MVVQCPTCQSKFRIADGKVTDRGVRVRCTSCKSVFPVQKTPGPAEVAAAVRAQPPPAPARPALQRPVRGGLPSEPPRLDVDDLFGMAELTGDAPLGDMAKGLERSAPPAPRAPPKPMPNFDDIEIDVADDAPPPVPARPPTGPQRANGVSTAVDVAPRPPPPPREAQEREAPRLGDPFAGVDVAGPPPPVVDLATQQRQPDPPAAHAPPSPPAAVPTPAPELPPGKGLVSSALTGLLGAALAIAVLVVAALSGDPSLDWLGFGPGGDVVATGVVSGLYDTASGKPVFYVRGRVENRGKKVHGPVRVTAELVADGAPEVSAAAIAGAEPSAEEVWALRSSADVDRLNHALESSQGERKLQPGASVPFFAVIADPPADLQRHRLHLKVEPVDAWVPSSSRKAR